MIGVDFWVDVSVDCEDVWPAIVIDVHKHRSPSQVMSIQAQSRVKNGFGKCSVPVVAIERGCVVRKIGLKKIRTSVAIIIGDGRTHTGLLAAILVEGNAHFGGYVRESSILLVVIENARGAVASHIKIGPAIVVIIESRDAEAVVAVRFLDLTGLTDIGESSAAEIVIEDVWRRLEAA